MILCEWEPQKDTLDRAAYTCMLVSYRRLSSQFQFSLSGVTLVYCISMLTIVLRPYFKSGPGDLEPSRNGIVVLSPYF